MNEHLLEIKIVQAGRVIGQYHPVDIETLRLENIIYPDETLPFDVGILPTALTPFDEPFAALVLGGLSHPINTEVESRLLGALQRNAESPLLLVTPVADTRAVQCLDELTAGQRLEISSILKRTYPGEWRWLTLEEIEPQLHTGALRYRKAQERGNHRQADPAWKPLHLGRPEASFAEAERYTAAEYTFFELPFRFQHYVSEYLAPDERILFATRRPAMDNPRKRSWLQRNVLQEGVLILTSQRLIHLAELVQPDSANIRYGFHTAVGVLERLAQVSVNTVGSESLLLTTTWNAQGGEAVIEWAMPNFSKASLDELVALLENFIVDDPDLCQLRRAGFGDPPDKLPPLEDTASNEPDKLIPLNEQFSAALTQTLLPNERAVAWALLPEWLDHKDGAQALVVTNRRLFLLPDRSFDISLGQITTIEYTGSILRSSIVINYFERGKLQRKEIIFPYPAEIAFRNCFEYARRCMAVVPLSQWEAVPDKG